MLDHLAGKLIPCRWDLQPVYMMLDIGNWDGNWDGDCQEQLDSILGEDRVVDGLTLMLYGGNYSTDPSTVQRICTYERYVVRVSERIGSSDIHESVRIALKKGFGFSTRWRGVQMNLVLSQDK